MKNWIISCFLLSSTLVIAQEKSKVSKQIAPFSTLSFGVLSSGTGSTYLQGSMGIEWKKRLSITTGFGLTGNQNWKTMQVFFENHINFTKKNNSPFLSLQGGFEYPTNYLYNWRKQVNGIAAIAFGYQIFHTDHVGFSLAIGIRRSRALYPQIYAGQCGTGWYSFTSPTPETPLLINQLDLKMAISFR